MKDTPNWIEIAPGMYIKSAPDLGAGPPLSPEVLEWSKKVAKYDRNEKRNRVASTAIFLVGLVAMIIGLEINNRIVAYAGIGITFLVILFWVTDSLKRRRLIKESPLPPHLQYYRTKN